MLRTKQSRPKFNLRIRIIAFFFRKKIHDTVYLAKALLNAIQNKRFNKVFKALHFLRHPEYAKQLFLNINTFIKTLISSTRNSLHLVSRSRGIYEMQ